MGLHTFRHPVDKCKLNNRGQTLKESNRSPGPFIFCLRSTPSSPSDEEGAEMPQSIVDSGDLGAMLRVADLSKQNRRAHLSKTVAKTKNEPSSHIDLPARREGRDESASDHDDTTDSNGDLAATVLSDVRSVRRSVEFGYRQAHKVAIHNEVTDDGTDIVSIVHDAQAIVIGRIEVFVPSVHLLRRVHHHTSQCQ